MSQWAKKGKYYATNNSYTMSWLDVPIFTLYYKKEHLKTGTKKECLDSYWSHFKEEGNK